MKKLLHILSALFPALRWARSIATKYVWPKRTRFFKSSLDPFLRCFLILSLCLTLLPPGAATTAAPAPAANPHTATESHPLVRSPSVGRSTDPPGTTARISAALSSSHVMFIENVGQFDERARLQVHGDMDKRSKAYSSPNLLSGSLASNWEIVFQDDFNDGDDVGWTRERPDDWSVQDGEYVLSFSGIQIHSRSWAGSDSWTDYAIEFSVKNLACVDDGLKFRGGCYGLNLRHEPGWAAPDVRLWGPGGLLADVYYPLGKNTWYRVRVEVIGQHIKVFIDGNLIIDYVDSSTPVNSGNIALSGFSGACGSLVAHFDDVVVLVPSPSAYEALHNSSPSSTTDTKVADPVSVIFGNYTYQHTDLSIPGLGPATTIQRTYNPITSSITTEGPFGYGWTHTYAISATQETTSTVMVKNEDGRLDRFTEDGEGGYTPPPGTFNTLTKNPDSTFTLTHKDQTQYHFDAADRLASIVDKNGNTVTLTYTGDNLTSITDAVGRTNTLTYDANNHITQITDSAGRTVTYDYDVDGNLTGVTDARGHTTTYTYDSEHRLLSITDANGHTFVQNTYDSQGRVIKQRDALGNLTTFSYDPAARQTTVTDPLGNQTVYTYDADWRATGETDALGYTESYTYDEHNNRTSVTDKNDNTTYYAYDANGNTTVVTDTMGYTTTMTYDAQNNLTGKTDALSRTTTFAYDTNGNLTSTTNVSGTTSFAYDGFGQMISTTDANGNTTQFGYDAYGYQTAITDTLGNVTTFTYDNVGRKLSETDANGSTTAYTYDAHNNLLTIADAVVGVTSYTYDDVGNRIGVTDSLSRTTTYTYDEKDRLASITDALDNTTTYAYDANDNRTQETNALGHTTVYTYNAVNLLVQVEDPLSNVTTYTYDGNGNRTSVTDANGNATSFTYDALNRLTQVVDPLDHTATYTYDTVGNKTSVTDANGNTTSYEYDALNRLIQVTDALSGGVTYDYDPVGNKTAMTDANGHVTQYEYDPLNRLLRVTDPLSNTTTYGYDAVGNKVSLLDANGNTTTYTYDALNRLIQITYPDSSVQYAYDAVGNRAAMTDTTGTTTYVYDALDRLTSVTSPGSSHTVSYSYDAVGNRTGITYPDGKEVTYTYDAANRLLTVTDWAARVTSYTYDPVGNLTAVSYPDGTEASYSYDDANRLLQLTNMGPGGTISSFGYTLDDVGNRTQVVEADGDVITYTYDALYRLTDVWEQMRVDFDIDCNVDVADIMEVANRWRMKDTDPGWDAWYDLDGDGDIDVVDIMLTVVRWGESCESASYTYDAMGNRLSMTTPTGTITYTYDAADRLLNISDGTTFTWDANGNQLSKGSTNYTYDTANRLTQVANGATTVQFTYDGDGKRTSKTVNGTSTSYLYDVNAILPVVLVETTGGANTLYTYGADLIAMTEPGGIQTYYHYDGLGSVRNLSDDTGAVFASYTYKAFGSLRMIKGSSDNAFKFTGEQTDDETGLIYLRARYYDPAVGRFIATDPVPGIDIAPQSHNRYVYARGNPIVFVDPNGLRYVYVQLGGGAYATVGGSFDMTTYIDPVTGEGAIVYSSGGGLGIGGGPSGEVGFVKHLPRPGFTISAKASGFGATLKGSASGNLGGGINTGTEWSGSVILRYHWIERSWQDWEDFYRQSILYPELGEAVKLLESLGYVRPKTYESSSYVGGGYGGGGGGSWGGPPSSGK